MSPVFLLLLLFIPFASWLAGFASRRLAHRVGAIKQPTGGRHIHARPIPELGGLGVGLTISVFISLGLALGWFPASQVGPLQLIGFVIAVAVLMIGGFLDDKFAFPPKKLIWFPLVASLIVIATGTGIVQVTNIVGNGAFSLVWKQWAFSLGTSVVRFSFPSDLLTLGWLLSVTFATKFMDGLDGLVTGQTVIGAGLIAGLALTTAYYQPAMATLAIVIGAAYLGFLPHNFFPAKQFLGESGSLIAGFSLGFLSIASGTKVATALMALGLPLVDASLVILGRLRRGVSPTKGDKTHLHFKLLEAGLSQREVVAIMWLLACVFGLAAFGVQTQGKMILLALLVGLTILLSVVAGTLGRMNAPTNSHRRQTILRSLVIAAVLLIGGGWYWLASPTVRTPEGTSKAPALFTQHQILTINGKTLTVEIASTTAEIEQGLGDRDQIPLDHGMLFLFDRPDRYAFWMRHMRFPLDMIWLKDGKIVEIAHDMPAPKSLEIPKTYTPKEEADRVIEVVAGQAEAYGMRVGEGVEGL